MRERQDVILGGGLAGLTAAYAFQQAGEDHWQVYEAEERPGGLARSVTVGGYRFDHGPHILFAIDPEIEALVRDLLGDNFHAQERKAYIYHHAHGLYTRFPFQAQLHGLPVPLVRECLSELVRAVRRFERGEFHPRNYEEWMRGIFGHAIAERLMIPYARKLWTVEPAEMEFSWTERRVPAPDFDRILAGALDDAGEGVGSTARFWYPKRGGIEPLPKRLAERVRSLHTGRRAVRIEMPEKRIHFESGEAVPFDHLLYSLPLPFIPRIFTGVPPEVERACEALRYQGIFCINLGIDRPDLTDKHWVYFYEDPFPFHRLSFPATFSPDTVPPGKSSVSVEVAFSEWAPLDRGTVVERTLDALRLARILRPDDPIELAHTMELLPAYVIYDPDRTKNVSTIESWLQGHNIRGIGRFGEWQYFNMDHSMCSGKRAAEEVLKSRSPAPL